MASPVTRQIYRSLLKVSSFFSADPASSKVRYSFLYRRGLDDPSWDNFLRGGRKVEEEEAKTEADDHDQGIQTIFNNIVREVVSGDPINGVLQMQFPCHVQDSNRLSRIIHREFRSLKGSMTIHLNQTDRQSIAFLALKKLNEKVALIESLEGRTKKKSPRIRAAKFVSALPVRPPSSYLRPGAFLISHPMMFDSYFERTVICILSHRSGSEPDGEDTGTYGIIVNRTATGNGNELRLDEVLRPLPGDLALAFGKSPIREGGPVFMSLQMVHKLQDHQASSARSIGGNVLPMIPENEDISSSKHSALTVRFRGDVMKAADAVLSRELDREAASFFVGASCWSPGQLESEIERGCWLPCRASPEIVHSGTCEIEGSKDIVVGQTDLWASMLAACGDDEAKLASLMYSDLDGDHQYAEPCDEDDMEPLSG